ncbi:hypothetical protein GGX14DRAFT_397405 [Mycena pura]|uniref:Ricin B lectin domain-containing protein n=1 Tax=Mycena pura TaxID=153505 RepID=A0AAD6V824_9AGAR|nr:hypothetical protein GGX14DRAFT_397405 [Mycena pura]
MQLTFAVLTAFISAAVAAPAIKRQNVCSLQDLTGLTVTASADQTGKTRWDIFGSANVLVQQGELGWFVKDQPSDNEVFTATVGSQPNLFTFQSKDGQPIGISGSSLFASKTAATFKVDCNSGCDSFASSAGTGTLAADGCTFELTDGTNGVGQCITFEAANSAVQVQDCQSGNPGQTFGLFSA